MGSPGWRVKPSSQSRRASSGWPELKAAVARRTMSSAVVLLISSTLEQRNGTARKADRWDLRNRPGASPAFFILRVVIVREGGRSSTPRALDSISDAGDYWIPAFAGMTAGYD